MTLLFPKPGLKAPGFPHVLPQWLAPDLQWAGLTWHWPPPGSVRMRKLLSRGARRPIFRFASLKLGRSVHMESLLEEQVALQLEACPSVSAYAEQPVMFHLATTDGPMRHVPDFAVLQDGQPGFLEIKYAKDVDAQVLRRTAILADRLAPFGMSYRLVTEADLPNAARLANAWALISRGRAKVSDLDTLLLHHQAAHTTTLGELGWGDPAVARRLARHILEGRLQVDLSVLLGRQSRVGAAAKKEAWLWA